MSLLKSLYKVFRSMVMTLIVLLVTVYLGLYVLLSVPAVQDGIKRRLCGEMSQLLGGAIGIREFNVHPFSEVILHDVSLDSPEGDRCVFIGKVAAGIDLWSLVSDRSIVLNYAEIIGLDLKAVQPAEHSDLNIQFLIDALSPKDKSKPPARFDLRVRNVVVRDSRASLSRPWMSDMSGVGLRLADLAVSNLRMDLSIPALRNNLFSFDVRNVSFDITPGISVRHLSSEVSFFKDTTGNGSDRLVIKDCRIGLPNSTLKVGDTEIWLKSMDDLKVAAGGTLTPCDFSALIPDLETFKEQWSVNVDASLRGKDINVAEFRIEQGETGSHISFIGEMKGLQSKDSMDLTVSRLDARLTSGLLARTLAFVPSVKDKVRDRILSLGDVGLECEGCLRSGNEAEAAGVLTTDIGRLTFSGSGQHLDSGRPRVAVSGEASEIALGKLLGTDIVGEISGSVDAEVFGLDRNAEGWVKVNVDDCVLMGNLLRPVQLEVNKTKNSVDLQFDASSDQTDLSVSGSALLAGEGTRIDMECRIAGLNPADYGVKGRMADC
ncbi:MAG: AsmA family protein, partial [Muribaculaceae bacterium]|nr:AsmA family protein [Muribaculaceae bacterium]